MYSMTGYGKGVASDGGKTVTVEIKTVNHRYLDWGVKLPRNFLFLEELVKKRVGAELSRGHVDVFLTYERDSLSEGAFTVDLALANSYMNAVEQLKGDISVKDDFSLTSLLRVPDIVKREQSADDEDTLKRLVEDAVNEALRNLKAMRLREGNLLKADISSKLDVISASLEEIKLRAPKVVESYRTGLKARIDEVLEPNAVDMQRLATEVALFADRCAIDEEITRLGVHISHMRTLLEADGPVGRKMDFLVQEFNRETNTIGSKANDMSITNHVLAIKNEIEKMREQAANVE